ncbi:acetyltransferase [Gammaproteobacteria bacterium]|nr:acetyltransferase [Gammaproteobacteria bacterium]
MNSEGSKKYILMGAGGHASVLLDIMRMLEYNIYGVCDPSFIDTNNKWNDLKLLNSDDYVLSLDPDEFNIVNGIGVLPGNEMRIMLQKKIDDSNLLSPTLIHPSASISSKAHLSSSSVQVMSGVVIQTGSKILANTIVNTSASIDHDCLIDKNVTISPGVNICGGVIVEENVFIGAGATIIQGVHIKKNSIIGAGTTVLKDVSEGSKIIN